jgi:hypothetical protein
MNELTNNEKWLWAIIKNVEEQGLWNHEYLKKLWNKNEKLKHLCSLLLQQLVRSGQITPAQKIKLMEDSKMSSEMIDISLFESKYFKLEDGDAADVILRNWKKEEFDYQGNKSQGIYAKVVEENGKEVEKVLNASSSLSKQLTPHLNEAVSQDKSKVKLRITRVGTGKNTRYSVKAI